MSFFLLDRSHRGHLGKKVLQQSLQCLLVYTRAVFPEILLVLLAPGTLSRLGLHRLSIFPIVGGFSGSLLLAIGRSPRASLFEQPLLVLFSPPSLPRPHFFFVLHPLLSFSPIHLVSILEVPRPLLESHTLLIVLVPPLPPLSLAPLLHRQNKQTTSRRLSFVLATLGVLGPHDPRTEQGSGPQSPQGGLPHGHQRASRPLDLAQFPTSGQDGLPVRRIPDSRPLVDLGPIRWRRSLSSTRSWYAASVFILAFRLSCDRRLCSRNLSVFFAFHTLSVSLRRCRLFSFQKTSVIIFFTKNSTKTYSSPLSTTPSPAPPSSSTSCHRSAPAPPPSRTRSSIF